MERFTKAITASLDAEIWFGALSLALMLPDICASLETPNEANGARYKRWFGKWLQPLYTKRLPVLGEHVFFSAEDAWQLRNSYLHAGNGEVRKVTSALERFHFIEPPGNGTTIHLNQMGAALQLQIDEFCNEVVEAVRRWDQSIAGDADIQERKKLLLGVHTTTPMIDYPHTPRS